MPARLQELTFARRAARRVRAGFEGATVLSRELETAHALRGRAALFLEVHPNPDHAPCDGLCQLRIEDFDRLLEQVGAIAAVVSPEGDARV